MVIKSEIEEIQTQDDDIAPIQKRAPPALTVVIQSWTTPIIGIVMRAAGLFGGLLWATVIIPAYEWDKLILAARVASGAEFSNGKFYTIPGRHSTFHKRASRHRVA